MVNTGSNVNLGNLVYKPPRNGPTLWEIGVPDRTTGEFFVPEPEPTLKVHVFTTGDGERLDIITIINLQYLLNKVFIFF